MSGKYTTRKIQKNYIRDPIIFHNLTREFIDDVISVMSFCLYNKKNITQWLEDMNCIFSWQKQYFTHSLRSFVKYCFATRK